MPGAPGPGPRQALGALGADVLALARARIELLALELDEEARRQKRMLWLAAVAALFLAAGLLALAVLVVVAFWDTYRLSAIALVCGAYLLAGGWAMLRLRDIVRNAPPPFSATIAEFERDLDMLKGHE